MIHPYLFLGLYSVCMFVLVILWLQSGIDKLTDFKGNYEWIKGQFAKSPLRGTTKLLLITLTLLEISAGLASAGAIFEIWVFRTWKLPFVACLLSMASLCSLFLGQRLSKEYGGAASLMGYMAYVGIVIIFTYILYAHPDINSGLNVSSVLVP